MEGAMNFTGAAVNIAKTVAGKALDTAEQRAVLQREIHRFIQQGYRVVSQTDTTAQLVKPKRFSLLWFFLLLGLFYIPFYLFARDKTVYLTVDPLGRLTRR
jgi:hypothetical protein